VQDASRAQSTPKRPKNGLAEPRVLSEVFLSIGRINAEEIRLRDLTVSGPVHVPQSSEVDDWLEL
jgi:hypothetical protein